MRINEIKKGSSYAYRRSIERASDWRVRPLNTSWIEIEVIDVLPLGEADEKYGTATEFPKTWSTPAHVKKWLERTETASQGGRNTKVIVGREVAIVSIYPDVAEGRVKATRMPSDDDGLRAYDARGMMGEAVTTWETKHDECDRFAKRSKRIRDRNEEGKDRMAAVQLTLINEGIKCHVAMRSVGGRSEQMEMQVLFRGNEQVDGLLERLGLTLEIDTGSEAF